MLSGTAIGTFLGSSAIYAHKAKPYQLRLDPHKPLTRRMRCSGWLVDISSQVSITPEQAHAHESVVRSPQVLQEDETAARFAGDQILHQGLPKSR